MWNFVFHHLSLKKENWQNKNPWFSYMSNRLCGRWSGMRPLPLKEVTLRKTTTWGILLQPRVKPGVLRDLQLRLISNFQVYLKISLFVLYHCNMSVLWNLTLQMTMTIHLSQRNQQRTQEISVNFFLFCSLPSVFPKLKESQAVKKRWGRFGHFPVKVVLNV